MWKNALNSRKSNLISTVPAAHPRRIFVLDALEKATSVRARVSQEVRITNSEPAHHTRTNSTQRILSQAKQISGNSIPMPKWRSFQIYCPFVCTVVYCTVVIVCNTSLAVPCIVLLEQEKMVMYVCSKLGRRKT